jgi:hypothetical protein
MSISKNIYKINNIEYIYNLLLKVNNQCVYIDKYGNKCLSKCLSKSPFFIRKYFCEKHIKSHTQYIIKFNEFISLYIIYDKYINDKLLMCYSINQLEREKIYISYLIVNLIKFLKLNDYYLLLSQPIISKIYEILYTCLTINLFNFENYKYNIYKLKSLHFDNIVKRNNKIKKESIETLIDLSYNNNNNIGNVFINSFIGDRNIFKLIECFI